MKKALILFLAGLFFSSFSLTASAQEMNACTGSNCTKKKRNPLSLNPKNRKKYQNKSGVLTVNKHPAFFTT